MVLEVVNLDRGNEHTDLAPEVLGSNSHVLGTAYEHCRPVAVHFIQLGFCSSHLIRLRQG